MNKDGFDFVESAVNKLEEGNPFDGQCQCHLSVNRKTPDVSSQK